jgi:hypothetical protein
MRHRRRRSARRTYLEQRKVRRQTAFVTIAVARPPADSFVCVQTCFTDGHSLWRGARHFGLDVVSGFFLGVPHVRKQIGVGCIVQLRHQRTIVGARWPTHIVHERVGCTFYWGVLRGTGVAGEAGAVFLLVRVGPGCGRCRGGRYRFVVAAVSRRVGLRTGIGSGAGRGVGAAARGGRGDSVL